METQEKLQNLLVNYLDVITAKIGVEMELEKILTDIILPITNKLKKDGIIDYWFYIKYLDPDYHLRLRFHRAKNATVISPILGTLKSRVFC